MSTALVPLQRRRDEVISRLSRAYETEELTDEEFEKRLDLAHRAGELETLGGLVGDLAVIEAAPTAVVARPVERQQKRKAIAIFGNTQRRGAWTPGAEQKAIAVFGNVELDFTQANLPPGITEVVVRVVLGNVELYVPPHLEVECEGAAILGNFETVERAAPQRDPNAPRLRIRGFAFLGNVEVITRLPGQRKHGRPPGSGGQRLLEKDSE